MSLYPQLDFDQKTGPSAAWIRSQYARMTTLFSERNREYSILRKHFDGDTANEQTFKSKLGQPFQDRYKLIYNANNASVRRYMDQMSAPPMIEGIPEGFEMADLELADKRTKWLEYIWDCNNMPVKLMHMAFYQGLLDKAVIHVRPAPQLAHKIRFEVGVPDFYYPITRGDDWAHPVAVIYGFRTYKGQYGMPDPQRFREGQVEFESNIEYWDETWFVRIEPERVIIIKHDLGVIPWFVAENLPIPHRFRGQGDIDQTIGLNLYLNMLMSAMGDMIAYAAAPIAVVRGTKVGGTNLPFAPRAVWELERDAQVGFLQWSGTPPAVEAQILRTMQGIEDLTGVSSPAFGREIPSGVSGTAVRSLMAGFNTRLGTKQTLLGMALVKANECAQLMAEKMFPDVEFRIHGESMTKGRELGQKKLYTVKPREFRGWYRNRLTFKPQDPAGNYFQEVDKYSKGLQSKYATMKNIGIQNVYDEMERMRFEKDEELQHQNNLGLAKDGRYQKPISPEEDAAKTQNLVDSLLSAVPKGLAAKQDRKKLLADTQKQSAVGAVGGPNTPASSPVGVPDLPEPQMNTNDLLAKLKLATNLSGRASLLNGNHVILDNPADETAIREAIGSMANKLTFSKAPPNLPLPEGAVTFYNPSQGQKKNLGTEFRDTNGYLTAAALEVATDSHGASVVTLGLKDDKGRIVPIGKTDPARVPGVEQGQLVRVSVGSMSRRSDGGPILWGIGKARIVKGQGLVAPSSLKDLERIFEHGTPRGS